MVKLSLFRTDSVEVVVFFMVTLGSHKGTGIKPLRWTVPKNQVLFQLCACKYTKDPPYCDASHVYLPLEALKRQRECENEHAKMKKLCTGCGKIPEW